MLRNGFHENHEGDETLERGSSPLKRWLLNAMRPWWRLSSELAKAIEAAKLGTGEAGGLKSLVLALYATDFCNEMDLVVRCRSVSSKKRTAASFNTCHVALKRFFDSA